jgi:hypothetical protein
VDFTRGGAKGTRTPNPLLAKQVRYLLRHGPWSSFALVGELLALVPGSVMVVHPALTPSGVCTVCAIRLAAPFTASEATVPTK